MGASQAAVRIAADIGATWARFRLQSADGRLLLGDHRVATATLGTGAQLPDRIRDFCAAAGVDQSGLEGVVLAVAGPVSNGRIRMTNGELRVDQAQFADALDCPVLVCNDYFALAHGLDVFSQLQPFGDALPDAGAVRLVLGPGSGLGVALCIPSAGTETAAAGRFRVLPSEGGHAPLPARTPQEHELVQVLQAQEDAVPIWETVLSGPGLLRLYRALGVVRGSKAPLAAPEAVTAAAAAGRDELAIETLRQFGEWLGECAASFALTTGAEGGIYLTGDLLRALAAALAAGPLRTRFEDREAVSGYLRAIAINLVLDPDPGLIGASALAVAQADWSRPRS